MHAASSCIMDCKGCKSSLVCGVDACAKPLQSKVIDKAPSLQCLCCVSHCLQAWGHDIPADRARKWDCSTLTLHTGSSSVHA